MKKPENFKLKYIHKYLDLYTIALQTNVSKADEEFAIEKAKIVRQETQQIDMQYDLKFKHAAMAQQIAASNITNKSRLKILNARQQVLDEIFEDAKTMLPNIHKNKKQYADLLKKLILEVIVFYGVTLIVGNVCHHGQRIIHTSPEAG